MDESITYIKKLMQKGYSSLFIQEKLKNEGISASERDILSIFEEERIGSKDQIKMLIEKKLPKTSIPFKSEIEKQKILKKLLNFILAKGHDFDETLNYLEEHF